MIPVYKFFSQPRSFQWLHFQSSPPAEELCGQRAEMAAGEAEAGMGGEGEHCPAH